MSRTTEGGRQGNLYQGHCLQTFSTKELVRMLNIDIRKVTFRQLTKLWDCTDTYLLKCMAEDMPYSGEGSKSTFDLEVCQKWHRGELVN